MEIDFHAKKQVNICKRLGKKSGKLKLTPRRTNGGTERWTEQKPKVPFGFAGRGLIKAFADDKFNVALLITKQQHLGRYQIESICKQQI